MSMPVPTPHCGGGAVGEGGLQVESSFRQPCSRMPTSWAAIAAWLVDGLAPPMCGAVRVRCGCVQGCLV